MNEQQEVKEFHPQAAELAKISNEMKAKAQTLAPTNTEVKPESSNPVEKIEKIINPEAEKPKEPEKVEPVTEPEPEVEEFTFGDFKAKEKTEPVDLLKSIGGALKFEPKDEKEIISKVSDLIKERDTLKASPIEGIPPQLQEAVEAARKGADWSSILGVSQTDYSKADAVQVFEHEYEKYMLASGKYKNPDGSIDFKTLDDDLDAIPENEKIFRGEEIKKRLVYEQQQKRNQIFEQAERQRQEFNSNLAEKSRELSKFFPKETFKVDLTPAHSEYFYSGIASRDLVKKHLGNIDEATLQKLDTSKLLRTIAAAEMAKELSERAYKEGQVSQKRELIRSNQNVQLETPATPARPDVSGDKPITPEARMQAYLSKLSQPGRL